MSLLTQVERIIDYYEPICTRKYFEDYDDVGCVIPPLSEEIELIRLLGSEVWAVTLNDEGLAPQDLEPTRARLEDELGLPVLHPLKGGMPRLSEVVRQRLAEAP